MMERKLSILIAFCFLLDNIYKIKNLSFFGESEINWPCVDAVRALFCYLPCFKTKGVSEC